MSQKNRPYNQPALPILLPVQTAQRNDEARELCGRYRFEGDYAHDAGPVLQGDTLGGWS
jgi:hypothetical protein